MRAETLQLVQLAAARRGQVKAVQVEEARARTARRRENIPRHQWNGTKIRFENPDGTWGPWVDLRGAHGNGGRGPAGDSAYQVAVKNGFVGTEQEWLDSLSGAAVFDDYAQADTRPGQSGPGVKRFAFDAEVQLVKVHPRSIDADALAWAAADADLTPADGTGDPCPANQDTHLFGARTFIDVWLPDGMTGYVTGYRRTAV